MIQGGTIDSSGGTLVFDGGELSGVTFEGPLNLTSSSPEQVVYLANGTTVVGSSGSGPSVINVTGDGAELAFEDTQTISNTTINLGNGNNVYSDSLLEVATGYSQVLTLASSVTIDVAGNADIGTNTDGYGVGIVNQGTIDQTGSGGALSILPTTVTATPNTFTNSGTIDAEAANGSLTIDAPTFTNNGSINVANGESAIIGPAVTGKGTNTISGGSTLEFEAGVSTAATLGDQDIGFSTGGGTLDLLAPASFYGEISGFGSGDTVDLKGSWAFSAISQSGGLTTLTLMSGSTTHGFEFVGDYKQSEFSITPGTTTKIGYV